MPDTTFRKEAHIIPELLGNKYLVSDFECDNCNILFNKYENELANWLGMVRTILGTPGKNKIPNYKSAKNEITTETINFRGQRVTMVSKTDKTGNAIKVDNSTGNTTLKYLKQAYVPIKVYKSMLKIALSMISETDVNDYDEAIKFLLKQEKDVLFDNFARMMCHQLPLMEFCVNKPHCLLFSKKDDNLKIPKHFFIIKYANFMYCFPLPFSKNDIISNSYKGQDENSLSIRVIYPPPILFGKPSGNQSCISYNGDFSSYDMITSDEDVLNLEISEDALKNLVSYDETTDEIKPMGSLPTNIVSLIVGNEKINIPLKN